MEKKKKSTSNEKKLYPVKNSNSNNYREHCINQIPRTAVSRVGGVGATPPPLRGEKRTLRARCEKTLKMTDAQWGRVAGCSSYCFIDLQISYSIFVT